MNILDHYNLLGKKSIENLEQSLKSSEIELLSSNHAFLHDFNVWLEALDGRPELDILENAIKEYQMSLLSNCLGQYQQAFMGLRFFLERTLVAILFSATEIELNLWKIGERDTYWSEIMEKDKGVFSHRFCRAFFPELKDEISHFSAITQKVYRECSEYVHGNLSVIGKLSKNLGYSEELFVEWNIKASIIKRVILFCLSLRYLKPFDSEKLKKIEPVLSEEFKSIPPIIEKLTN